jgi:hypothetical protein
VFVTGLRRRSWRWALGLLALAVLGCTTLEVLWLRAPTRAELLSAARERWAGRPFTSYRLVTEHVVGIAPCQQDAQVAGERVVSVFRNTCGRSAVTITNLFLDIERLDMTIGGRCGPNGCACDGPIDVDVTYDRTLGYPRQLTVRSKPERRWLYLDYWRALVSGSACRQVGFDGPTINVLSVEPTP